MIRHNRFLIIIAAGALILVAYLIGQITYNPFDRQWLHEIKSGPEYAMRNTRSVQYDAAGLERFRMNATEISQSPNSGIIDIVNPKIVLQDRRNQAWQIQADRGQIFSSNEQPDEQLLLKQNVVISRQASDTDRFSIKTSELAIAPKDKQANSSKPVVISSHHINTSATGLDLDFERGIVKLRSQVQTAIHPQLNPPSQPASSNPTGPVEN